MARLVKIKCLEEQIFEVELSAARLSPKLMELLNSKTTSDETPIVLEDGYMTSDVLGRILAWCTRHKDDSEDKLAVSDSDEDEYEDWTMHRNRLALLLQKRYKPLPSVSKWDRQFMTAESNINLYGIILGALFLKIKKLKSIATSAMLYRLNNMKPSELRVEISAIMESTKAETVVYDDDEIKLESIDISRRG